MNPELKRIPAPAPDVMITVPLKLLPAYLKLHKLESVEYKEVEETLIIKRITPSPANGQKAKERNEGTYSQMGTM